MKLEELTLSMFLLCGLAHADDASMAPRTFDNYEKSMFNPPLRYPIPAKVKPKTSPAAPSPLTPPSVPTIPPFSPCSSTGSCAPGVGLESGEAVRWQEQLQMIDKEIKRYPHKNN